MTPVSFPGGVTLAERLRVSQSLAGSKAWVPQRLRWVEILRVHPSLSELSHEIPNSALRLVTKNLSPSQWDGTPQLEKSGGEAGIRTLDRA